MRFRVPQQRHPAAAIGIPQRQLMEIVHRAIGSPLHLVPRIPVADADNLPEKSENVRRAEQRENRGPRNNQERLLEV